MFRSLYPPTMPRSNAPLLLLSLLPLLASAGYGKCFEKGLSDQTVNLSSTFQIRQLRMQRISAVRQIICGIVCRFVSLSPSAIRSRLQRCCFCRQSSSNWGSTSAIRLPNERLLSAFSASCTRTTVWMSSVRKVSLLCFSSTTRQPYPQPRECGKWTAVEGCGYDCLVVGKNQSTWESLFDEQRTLTITFTLNTFLSSGNEPCELN